MTTNVIKMPARKLFKIGDRVRASKDNPFLDQLIMKGLDIGTVVGFGSKTESHLIWVKPTPRSFARRGYQSSWHVSFWEKY